MDKQVYEFISQQTNDPIVERKTCAKTGEVFPIFQSEKEFFAQISPTFGGQKFSIPTPRLCPSEREKRRTVRRNERKLYRRNCDATGKPIITQYAPDAPYKVYDQKVWRGDIWNPLEYGRDFDFSKTFTENYKELYLAVPKLSLYNINPTNSEYCHCCTELKDCYLTTGATNNEECLYCHYTNDTKKCIDCYMTHRSENCYQCMDCTDCYALQYGQNCHNCRQSFFLYGCDNCSHCFGCSNLVGKQYCIFNEQKTQQEYEIFLQSIQLWSKQTRSQYFQQFQSIIAQTTKPAIHGIQLEKTVGNFVNQCKESFMVFNGENLENCRYTFWFNNAKNCQDLMSRWDPSEMCYHSVAIGSNASFTFFCANASTTSYVYYSTHCTNCQHCFWCTGLTNQSYCIFNKQYSKEEYEQIVAKIIIHMQSTGEWGEFFDPSLAPFAYNETVAQELHPLTEVQSKGQWYRRQTDQNTVGEGNIATVPDNINNVQDDILQQIISCQVSWRLFKITKQELDFYRTNSIPIPTKHPDIRHQERIDQRPAKQLYLRICDKTGKQIISVYPADAPFKVYSIEAYQQDLYG